jgi:cyclase
MLRRLASWSVDEILILDVSRALHSQGNWHSRWDRRAGPDSSFLSFIARVAETINVPLTVGGGIRSVEDALNYLNHGADRVTVNSLLFENPNGVSELISEVGAQAVVASLDVEQVSHWRIRPSVGSKSDIDFESMLLRVEALRPGELLMQSVNDDGRGLGFNLKLATEVQSICSVPLMLASGAGSTEHFVQAACAGPRALVSANMWHFKELVGPRIKEALRDHGVPIRPDY